MDEQIHQQRIKANDTDFVLVSNANKNAAINSINVVWLSRPGLNTNYSGDDTCKKTEIDDHTNESAATGEKAEISLTVSQLKLARTEQRMQLIMITHTNTTIIIQLTFQLMTKL